MRPLAFVSLVYELPQDHAMNYVPRPMLCCFCGGYCTSFYRETDQPNERQEYQP